MGYETEATEPFIAATSSHLVSSEPRRAVVEQPPLAELDNHVGVRHASALHAAGYEASRALVAAALAELDGTATMQLSSSEVAYTAVGIGALTTIAEPGGESWDELLCAAEAELVCAVTTSNEEGKAVAQLNVTWVVSRANAA